MKKTVLVLCILLLASNYTFAYEERNLLQNKADITSVKNALVKNKAWVKYPQYKDRTKWDLLTGKNKTDIIEQGEAKLDYKWQVVTATNYLDFERNGTRVTMENPFNANTNAIAQLFVAELAEGKGRFVDQIVNGVFHTCEMTSWALSAHLINQSDRRSLPSEKEQLIDLVSGDVSAMFSWIHYFMKDEFDKINPTIARRLKYEITKRSLIPYMDGNQFRWMALSENWNGFVNNWNPWCNSNILTSFLLIEDDHDKLSAAVYKTMTSVDKFINYTKSDGACEEGPAYWGHAAGKMYDYLEILSDATDGKIAIFDQSVIKNMGEYISRSYVNDGWVVNFADAGAKMTLDYNQIYRYGKAVDSREMMQFAAYLKQKQSKNHVTERDMHRTLITLLSASEVDKQTPVHNHNTYTWYPQTEFCYLVAGNMFFASKGGFNDESHNHNDAGTFSLYIDNYPAIIDVGVGTYTRQTFSSQRYSIWTMQSDYHNLPLINGYSQKHGKAYKANNVQLNKSKNEFSLDISKAYPQEAQINSWLRNYKLGTSTLKIEDRFDISKPDKPNQINFMTWGKTDITRAGVIVILLGNGKTIELAYDKNMFTPSIDTMKLDDKRLSNVWGNQVYRISLNATKIISKGKYQFAISQK